MWKYNTPKVYGFYLASETKSSEEEPINYLHFENIKCNNFFQRF